MLGDLNLEALWLSWTIPLITIVVLLCWIGLLGHEVISYLARQEARDQHFYGEWAAERLLQKAEDL